MEIGYVNARVRGMKGRLLQPEALEKMLHKPDVEAIISQLEGTAYHEDLERASVQYAGIYCIEHALRMNLVRTYRTILRIIGGEPFAFCIHIFLNKWDIQNIKTVLRGKHVHIPHEETLACLVPAGELDEATLVELVKQPDIRSIIDMLATWEILYALPLTKAYPRYQAKRDLAVLEYALDKFYFGRALASLQGRSYNEAIVRNLLQTEIDITNIKSLLRLLRDKVSAEDGRAVLIPGGKHLDVAFLSRLMSQGGEDALAGLARTPYASAHPAGRLAGKEISVYEKELDRMLVTQGIGAGRGDPLSIALVIGYLWLKSNEITNIRIISRCKNAFVPDDEIREELMYV
ncbi:MAG: V-type ATP synthase subunit C [Methanomicrobiales archaeon]|nr:V-type ATP synthase subunit C [Methanomicrobiales archaeon]